MHEVVLFVSFVVTKYFFLNIQGQNGSHFEQKIVPPPLPNKCDWEIDPAELDFSNSSMIGKVGHY